MGIGCLLALCDTGLAGELGALPGLGWFSVQCAAKASIFIVEGLQVSSFIFTVPQNRPLSGPMIWQEWQLGQFTIPCEGFDWIYVLFIFIHQVAARLRFLSNGGIPDSLPLAMFLLKFKHL